MSSFIDILCWRSIRYLHNIEIQKKIPLLSLLGKKLHFKILNWVNILPVKYRYACPEKGQLERITLVFNGDVCNAGLADRLRSIASVYHWCEKHGIRMNIYFNKPFCLSDFLEPNQYDWVEKEEDFDYDGAYPKALISFSSIFGEDFNCRQHREYLDNLILSGHKHIHLYTNTYCYDESFKSSFDVLFKLNDRLEKEIDDFQKQIGGCFITASFRFAQLLGDLKDTYGTPLPDVERAKLITKCKNAIYRIVELNKVDRCVITSDSVSFLNEVSKLPNVYLLPGSVGHISNDVSEDQVRKTFWDMLIISRAEKAYMVRTPIMYKSGFAKRAAMISGIPFEEFEI